MEAHLALHCKGPVPENIRRKWLIEVAKRGEKILEEQPDIFTNKEVFEIVFDEDDVFYTSCKRIALIFEPIKRVINLLKACTASLANCFMGIIQIAIALRRIPPSNNFCSLAIAAFNLQYEQFDISPYLLTYFLHPNYRSHGLKKGQFRYICELAVNYDKNLHHSEKECHELVTQLIKYKARVAPWDLEYSSDLMPSTWWGVVKDEHVHLQELAETIFAIAPSQANCERNFSILKWFSEEHCTRLQVSRLESMAQIHSFYVSNIKKELKFCDDNFVETELCNSVLNKTVFAEMDNIEINEDEERDEIEIMDLIVNDITTVLQDMVDLLDPIFGANNNQEEPILTEEEMNMEFESRSIVQDILSDSDLYE
ncbi:hypothetical protein C2G38_2316042 [Gigaspora rosea]|uniref:HAT C-terminal dimerisation domain-containing protein n=1 Tax=Gigaspora rosea TaxID=44941 RepID=A0A397V4S7_9GLOM|nr:hypothetical protein C2G38_2316042 [Gigaspora rosea]